MCGILGGNNPYWDYEKGIQCMKHRGPDGTRIARMDDFSLAFTRLAIIDLSDNAMQPMFSEDYKVGIVFNGEIYGFTKLRNILIKRGYKFRSTSDTEVILNAYLEWGEHFITKIDGMYGIAILDKRDGTVKLFRDRMGIKPLYYYYDGTNFGFASELKGIVNMCNTISFQIDNSAVYDYLNYLYIPDPKTYYKKIYKLQPAHRLTFDIKSQKILKNGSYWKLNVNEQKGSQRNQKELIEELRYLMREYVKEQMMADVPVGTFLSGGVDSSIITYESGRINSDIETFSIGFTDAQYDESRYALMLAKQYNISNNLHVFQKDILNQNYDKLKLWYDEPFADTSAFPTYLVSGIARKKVTVVLTGDGGDEIFGGYPRYTMLQKKEFQQGHIRQLLERLLIKCIFDFPCGLQWEDGIHFLQRTSNFPLKTDDKTLRKQLKIDKYYDKFWAIRKNYRVDLPPVTRAQFVDIKTYLPGDILTKVDRASMAVSLETRVPFLDKRIVEFAFSLSEDDRCPNGECKGLLKKAYEQEVGKEILYRPKKGFSIPRGFFSMRKSPQEDILKKIWT